MKKLTITLLAFAIVSITQAQDLAKGKVEGVVFTNWHADFTKSVKQSNAFEITRIYLGYKYQFDENLAGKVLFEVDGYPKIDTVSKKVYSRFQGVYSSQFKNAYLEWKNALPFTTLEIGMHGTRLFKVQEDFWGYRYVYKTVADQYGLSSSADLGATAIIQPVDKIKINVFAMNGDGYKSLQDAFGKNKYGAGIEVSPFKNMTAYTYYDNIAIEAKENQSTIAAFLGYKNKTKWRLGIDYHMQFNNKGIKDRNLTAISGIAAVGLTPSIELFARYDHVSSERNVYYLDGSTYLGGLQYTPVKGIKVAANYQGFAPKTANVNPLKLIFMSLELKF